MRKNVVLIAIAISGFAILLSASSGAQTSTNKSSAAIVKAGQEKFATSCLQCHAPVAGQTSFGPNLSGEIKPPHPRKSATEVRSILQNGKGKMPPFKDKLTPQDIDNLLAYLRTL
jgi:mono/diheme cytochrome c family protein